MLELNKRHVVRFLDRNIEATTVVMDEHFLHTREASEIGTSRAFEQRSAQTHTCCYDKYKGVLTGVQQLFPLLKHRV